ncbi:hypothetical protein [Labrys sp. WJW]|uniref:hypothetical protein n=1 Tax=Labrys sp. WJW TaxID=1737983 RepID=UPI0012E9B8D1|nr:hypothetical protein [Labrys sp. WJW]
MGLLTDVLIADAAEAKLICEIWPRERRWPAIETKGLDNSKFAALAAAWGDHELSDTLESGGYIAATRSDEGPWVFVFPDSFRDRIAAIEPARIPEIAKAWSGQRELELDGWKADDLDGPLLQLREFAARAVKQGKSLLLWMSL